MGDLINAALRDYLHRRRLEDDLQLMAQAAADPEYCRLIRSVGEELAFMDADGLSHDY